jgi:hypothetical protein
MQLATILFAFALPLITYAQPPRQTIATPTGIVTLASLRGLARPLLIFAPTPTNPLLEIQLRRLYDNAPAIAARNIVVIAIPYDSPSPTRAMLTDDDAQAARRRFNIPPSDFAVILLSKNGSEKLRSSKPLSIEKLRNAIDTQN